MRVRKNGRTTGLTEGVVKDSSYDALVGMDHMNLSIVAFFDDQIRIERVAPIQSPAWAGTADRSWPPRRGRMPSGCISPVRPAAFMALPTRSMRSLRSSKSLDLSAGSMSDALMEAKRRLSSRYLGQGGIHGFGLRRSEGAVCVYIEPRPGTEQRDLLHKVGCEVAPFRLVVIREERASMT